MTPEQKVALVKAVRDTYGLNCAGVLSLVSNSMTTWNLSFAEYRFPIFASSVQDMISHLPEEVNFTHYLLVQIFGVISGISGAISMLDTLVGVGEGVAVSGGSGVLVGSTVAVDVGVPVGSVVLVDIGVVVGSDVLLG